MYILFAGTTDYQQDLLDFLTDTEHTLLKGTSYWKGRPLQAQVILFFNKQDAKATKHFLKTHCKQQKVPLKRI